VYFMGPESPLNRLFADRKVVVPVPEKQLVLRARTGYDYRAEFIQPNVGNPIAVSPPRLHGK
jgi:hypothetical protein